MTSTKKKAGRKQIPHKCSWDNSTVDGLYRCKDGRWRINATGQKFTEADERLAVAKFYRLTGGQRATVMSAPLTETLPSLNIPTAKFDALSPEEICAAAMRAVRATKNLPVDISFDFRQQESPADWELSQKSFAPLLWAWFREQILKSPKHVARMTGIEEIGYLDQVQPPEVLPTFKEMTDLWNTHATCGDDQKSKVQRAFEDFLETTNINTIRDITPEIVVMYQDHVYRRISHRRDGTSGPIAGKQQQHLFTSIKTFLRFIKRRAIAVKTIGEVLNNLSILKPSESATSLDPRPLSVEEWKKLFAIADGEDLAMILLLLNGAFYLREVISLNWTDIDEKNMTITTHRKKTGQCVRVCVLWKETIAALASLPRRNGVDWIFSNYTGERLGISGAQMRFTALAKKAGVDVTASQLRDGAFTAAVEANVTSALCNILVGHRSGMSDRYVKRNPRMVAPACEAVHGHFWA